MGLLPSIFVVLVLLALVVVPIAVEARIDAAQAEIEEVVEPAQRLLSEIQFLLARQNSELRGFLVTADAGFLDSYERLVARERQIYPELERLAAEIGPEILAHIVELRTLSGQWHQRLAASRDAPDGENLESLRSLVMQDGHFRSLDAAGRADLALQAAILDRRQEVRDFTRGAQLGYGMLVTLALGATVAVAMLNLRIRRLAAEANRRTGDIERALDETARAVAARADLIRGFTHDVKNPLGAADGYAQLLEAGIRGTLSPEQTATVANIRRSIRGATEIIEQLLDLSRLESGGLTLRREPVDLRLLLAELADHYSGAAANAGIEISVFVSPNEPVPTVFSDPGRIRQILDNLVTNAIKYTPGPGRVILRIQGPHSETPPWQGAWTAVSVSDTGPGIPSEELERIFDEFHRVPGTAGTGHGLGLAISRRIARLLGGDVTVRSSLGEGSTFLLWLPLRDPSEPDRTDTPRTLSTSA
jgi:signal transduction histidine kinase